MAFNNLDLTFQRPNNKTINRNQLKPLRTFSVSSRMWTSVGTLHSTPGIIENKNKYQPAFCCWNSLLTTARHANWWPWQWIHSTEDFYILSLVKHHSHPLSSLHLRARSRSRSQARCDTQGWCLSATDILKVRPVLGEPPSCSAEGNW